MNARAPIGVFDSGVGGLTVFRALREALPHEDFLYLGDTARVPYGTRSQSVVERYTLEATTYLLKHDIKFLVVACNTASAYGLEGIQREFPDLPYCGVITAGAEVALQATQNNRFAVLATEGTVRSGVYPEIVKSLRSQAYMDMRACNLLVSLVEEGWIAGDVAERAVARYLSDLEPGYDTLILACTHFPLLKPLFCQHVPEGVTVVDCAERVAQTVSHFLAARQLLNMQDTPGRQHFRVTDAPDRFARIASIFLDDPFSFDISLVSRIDESLENQLEKAMDALHSVA